MKLLLRPISILKGLHWVSWCVLLVVGLGLLLIMVPGEEFSVVRGQPLSDTWDANSLSLFTITQSNVDEPLKGARSFFRTPFEHGWPARYLVRSIERCDLRLGIAGNPPLHHRNHGFSFRMQIHSSRKGCRGAARTTGLSSQKSGRSALLHCWSILSSERSSSDALAALSNGGLVAEARGFGFVSLM